MAIETKTGVNLLFPEGDKVSLYDETASFPSGPRGGEFILKEGILYIWTGVDGVRTWYPLNTRYLHNVFVQKEEALIWTVYHGTNAVPISVMIHDETGELIQCKSFDLIDDNSFSLTFDKPTKGRCVTYSINELYAPAGQPETFSTKNMVVTDSLIVGGVQIGDSRYYTKQELLAPGASNKIDYSNLKGAPTALRIKEMYESNANTHALTDSLFHKLNTCEENANFYIHPTTHSADMITDSDTRKLVSDAELTKLRGVEAGANKYIHPQTHSANVIVEEVNRRFITDNERSKLSGIASNANLYVHPETHPAGMIVEDMTRIWFTPQERTKLEQLEINPPSYIHPSSHPASMILTNETLMFISQAELDKLDGIEDFATADMTASEIKAAYESNPNTNCLTSALLTKLEGIEAGATGDLTAEEIKAAYESIPNTNAFTDDLKTKLSGIEAEANKYIHPDSHPASMVVTDSTRRFITQSDIDKLETIAYNANNYIHPLNHPADMVTETTGKLWFTPAERTKLEGIEAGSFIYTHPVNHPAAIILEDESRLWFTPAERTKLNSIAAGANLYVHPSNHLATMVIEDATHRFFTDTERTKLQGIAEFANNYLHPDTHPATMIVESTDRKFMLDAERSKLAGIEANANNYVHPSTHAATMIADDPTHRFFTDTERLKLQNVEENANMYVHPETHPATIIVQDGTHRMVTDTQIAKWDNDFVAKAGDTITGVITMTATPSPLVIVGSSGKYRPAVQDGNGRINWYWNTVGGATPVFELPAEDASCLYFGTAQDAQAGAKLFAFRHASGADKVAGDAIVWTDVLSVNLSALTFKGNTVFHTGNMGANSGLDADKLDGLQAASFARLDASTTPTVDNAINMGTESLRYANIYAVNFQGNATSAYYADVAEKYTCASLKHEVGTVMVACKEGSFQVEPCNGLAKIVGVVSEKPAHTMNCGIDGIVVGLVGMVPVKIAGPIRKGDVICSGDNGTARVVDPDSLRDLALSFGSAFETNEDQGVKLVLCSIKG